MALNISGGTLTIKGTPIELDSVYVRISVHLPANGQMLVEKSTYYNREGFDTGVSILVTEVESGTTTHELPTGNQLLAAHEIVAQQYKALGYDAKTIDL